VRLPDLEHVVARRQHVQVGRGRVPRRGLRRQQLSHVLLARHYRYVSVFPFLIIFDAVGNRSNSAISVTWLYWINPFEFRICGQTFLLGIIMES